MKKTLKLRSGAVIPCVEPSTAEKKNYLSRYDLGRLHLMPAGEPIAFSENEDGSVKYYFDSERVVEAPPELWYGSDSKKEKYVLENGAKIVNEKVTALVPASTEERRIAEVVTEKGRYAFDAVIVCTGGVSYPTTGSDGDGIRFAEKLGHKITPPIPSLIGLTSGDGCCAEMQGLALKNVALTVTDTVKNKKIYADFGEMLFTHFGVSGPMVLSASAHMRPMENERYELSIDLKPALDEETLDKRIVSDLGKYKNKELANALCDLLPASMIKPVIARAGLDEAKKAHSVTQKERRALLETLKGFKLKISGTRPIAEAIVTSGGVAVSEISPATMQSKKWENLYFAGEVIDVDAYTGGFNLQIAYSTGMKAAESAVYKLWEEM